MSPKVTLEHEYEQRQRIMCAAARCFCRTGYHRATIQDVCDEASLSKGGLYTYFKSKEELLTSVLQESFTTTLRRAQAAAGSGRNALEKLDRVADAVVEGFRSEEMTGLQSPKLFLEIWAEASKNRALNTLYVDGYSRWRVFLTGLLREGIAEGIFKRDVDPDALVTILLAAFDGLTLHEGVTQMKVDWRHVVQTLRRGLTEGIVRGTTAVSG